MILLGIDDTTGLVYERSGAAFVGVGVWPSPILIPANILSDSSKRLEPTSLNKYTKGYLLFREDAFDPVSRIRRGRLYINNDNQQPQRWQVGPHPGLPTESANRPKELLTYYPYQSQQIQQTIGSFGAGQPLIVLGLERNITVWSLVSIESTATSDVLVTLRMRQSFGALPRIRQEAIPTEGRENLINAINILSEDLRRAGPESVIDRAREVVVATLSCYLKAEGITEVGLDLDQLIKRIKKINEEQPEKGKNIVYHASYIVRLFHSRGKNAVRERLQVPPLREQDAELAVQCVGTILRDLGWAQWDVV